MDSQTRQLPGPAGPGPTDPRDDGPRVTGEQVRDFRRLRRTRTDRYVAGVAGGLGRHFDVDPTLVRVVLVVLAFFGGAGLLVYAAVWLLVPADDQDRAPLGLGPDLAKVLVVAAVVVAGMILLGVPWLGVDGGWIPWPLVLVAVLVTWLVTRTRERTAAPDSPYDAVPGAPAAPPAADAPMAPGTPDAPAAPGDPTAPGSPGAPGAPTAPASWGPPPPPLPPRPARPRRTGPVLFWPTLAAIALALGVLGLLDVSADVPVSAYAALALAVTGVALLLGAFRARPGGLIALGLLLVLTLGATSAVDAAQLSGTYRETTVAPSSPSQLQEAYDADNGDFTLDLTGLTAAELGGRDVAVEMGTGQLTVLLPADATTTIDSRVRVAGALDVDGTQSEGGLGFSTQTVVDGGSGTTPLDLDLDLRLGAIEVRTR